MYVVQLYQEGRCLEWYRYSEYWPRIIRRLPANLSKPGNWNRFCLGNRLRKLVDYVVEMRECGIEIGYLGGSRYIGSDFQRCYNPAWFSQKQFGRGKATRVVFCTSSPTLSEWA